MPMSSVDVSEVSDATPLKGKLKGLKLYVMHCKAPMEQVTGIQRGKLSKHIASELRVLVEQEGLGLEVIAVEQGMRICKLFHILAETPGSLLFSHLRPSSPSHATALLPGSYGRPDARFLVKATNITVSLGHTHLCLFIPVSIFWPQS